MSAWAAVATQTAASDTARSVGPGPTPTVLATVRVVGSISITVCSFEFRTQTPPAPTSTAVGVSPTGTCSSTLFFSAFMTAREFGLAVTSGSEPPDRSSTRKTTAAASAREHEGGGCKCATMSTPERGRALVRGAQRWEGVCQSGCDHLEEVHGPVHVLELPAAEIAEPDILGKIVLHEVARRPRHEDLATVSCRHDAGCPVDAEPDVPIWPDHGLPRIHAHAHEDVRPAGPRVRGERPLARDRRLDGFLRPVEGNEERVTLCVDLPAAGLCEHRAEQALVRFEDLVIPWPPSSLSSCVEPSMSVKRKVTVPRGNSDMRAKHRVAGERRSPSPARSGIESRRS